MSVVQDIGLFVGIGLVALLILTLGLVMFFDTFRD